MVTCAGVSGEVTGKEYSQMPGVEKARRHRTGMRLLQPYIHAACLNFSGSGECCAVVILAPSLHY
jgi:hypothetical protein